MKLLIVEDDPDQLQLLCSVLEDHFGSGVVTTAANITHALAHDLASFDLILADYNLPDGTGLDLLEQVRLRCLTPVMMVTGENVGRIATESVRRGATDYLVKSAGFHLTLPLVVEKNIAVAKVEHENQVLRRELELAFHELQIKNEQLQQSLIRVEQAAATDPLTGLYNRRHFGKVIEQLFAEAQRYDGDLSCVMIDLDCYKQLNDSFGHQVGDQLLVCAARAITANLRKMDIAARYGGDEFILLLPRASTAEAATVVSRIREDFAQSSALVLHRPAGVNMSVGIGSLRGDNVAGTEQLIARADAALYRAKAQGRNRIVISDQPVSIPA